MTERVHPVVIPFSSRCQSDVISPEVDSKPEILIVIQDKALDLARHMVSVQGSLNQLIRYRTIGFFKPKHNKVSLPFASLLYQLSDSCVFQTHCHTRDASFPNWGFNVGVLQVEVCHFYRYRTLKKIFLSTLRREMGLNCYSLFEFYSAYLHWSATLPFTYREFWGSLSSICTHFRLYHLALDGVELGHREWCLWQGSERPELLLSIWVTQGIVQEVVYVFLWIGQMTTLLLS